MYAQGLADFDKAVALAPTVGRYVYLRAQARLASDEPLLAALDLEKAAALMPADVDVRLTRAALRLTNGDTKGAAEDIKVADAGLAPGSDRRLALASLYYGVDEPEAAIVNFDAWLKLHGQDSERATAYNGRCFARGLLNRELDRALSDCNTALRLRPGLPAYLDSRALVELRLGKLDAALADYDAALKIDPKAAWTLYARAIAEKRAGKDAKAAEDRKAALAIDPDLSKRARKFGLES
jgi:tetratricopeptide (TPR) repeat protein